jgi:hypothetical protein
MEAAVHKQERGTQSELLQLFLPDAVRAQKGSEEIIYQGGAALRRLYNGLRF